MWLFLEQYQTWLNFFATWTANTRVLCVCVFFLRDLFLHYIIITIFINSSKLSTLLVLMKIDLHWRRECLHVKSKPAIYNVCYLIKLNNILFCIATLQSCMKQPSFHLKLSWAFTCTCLRAYLGDDRAKKNKILTNPFWSFSRFEILKHFSY